MYVKTSDEDGFGSFFADAGTLKWRESMACRKWLSGTAQCRKTILFDERFLYARNSTVSVDIITNSVENEHCTLQDTGKYFVCAA